MNISTIFAGVFGAQAIISAAFSAHSGLDDGSVALIDKAVQFQMWHALALLFIGQFWATSRFTQISGALMILGVTLFCGSLYLLGFAGMRLFPMAAPLGGISLILGWVSLAVFGFTKRA